MIAKPPRTPKLRRHSSGQGFVELNGRRIYLGPYGHPETRQLYHRSVAEWEASGRQAPLDPDDVTVVELCVVVWRLFSRRKTSRAVRSDGPVSLSSLLSWP